MNIKVKKQPFWVRFTAALAASLMLVLAVVPVRAIDIQPLADTARAGIGFTHRARIQYTDLTNGVAISQWRLFPGSGNGAVGDVIDRAAVYIDTRFNLPQIATASNLVLLSVGTTGVTNNIINLYDLSVSNQTQLAFVTNLAAPVIWSAANSNLVVTTSITNAAGPALLTAGDVYVYFRVMRLDRISNP